GCVPAPLGKYYKPIYSDSSATYSGDACGGKAGAPASLTVVLADGVTLTIDAWRSYGEKSRQDRPLHISIQIPKDVRAQFLSNDIRVSTHAQDSGQDIPTTIEISAAVMIPSDGIVDMQKIAPTPFPDRSAMQAASKFSASTGLNFSWKDNFVPASISMDLPAIIVLNGNAREQPPVKLLANAKKRPDTYPGQYKSSTSLIYSTQESEVALAQKYARCTKETPHLKCNQILLYDEGTFNLDQQGFNFSGRLYVFDVENHSPFNGELNVKYREPFKWRFSTNKIRITDLSTMTERIYQFDKFPLYFGYEVPLSTPTRGVNDSPYSKNTTLRINLSLGTEDLQKYVVKLPPILINGKPHQIKPIELEKRVFDFGLEPFNC
ncbi:MAG: hypothetical protein Q7K57_60775, partial [Burkholderiaceae bacterium]|nr:hypothetical protein [Burkholderiaceae bacterium]